MGETSIEDLFDGPWGIVESRRSEVETGSYGAFDRVYDEEVVSNFLPIREVASMLGCHESTARDWLNRCDARYIKRSLAHLFYRPDVETAKAKRAELKADRKASQRAAKGNAA
jgi:hypothetical protein